MGYEVDFIGTKSDTKSGDAIAVRFGDLHTTTAQQKVVVIDGGFSEDGETLVNHIKTHYGTDRVDLVISTHPDQDHINGLKAVLEQLTVKELWIHKAWEHNAGIASQFRDGRITDSSVGDRLKATLNKAHELCELAESKGINVKEPFAGTHAFGGALRILGPSVEFYENLLPDFEGMPDKQDRAGPTESLLSQVTKALKKIFVRWGQDHQISDEGVTSAKNNSSVITQLVVDGRKLVFTADAGIQALDQVANQLDACQLGAELKLVQIPHHGSRRNVGPSVLNRIVGQPVGEGEKRGISAIVSAASKSEKHPRKSVLNAFTHRGATVSATRGGHIRHSWQAPSREGWGPVKPEPYHYELEEEV
jgi:beta-lactamase superfamily II metal-dependent hydrolase